MLATRRQCINTFADHVRRVLEIGDGVFPVNVETCIERLGGQLVRTQQAEEAKIEKVGESFCITIREGLHPNRERFSLAHEIGHLFLHWGFWIDEDKWNAVEATGGSPLLRFGYSDQEFEAHEFAAAVLMPKDAFWDEVAKNLADDTIDLRPVAERFGVSVEAAKLRGRWLGLFRWNS